MTPTMLKPKIIKPARVVTPQCCIEIDPPLHAPEWRKNRYSKLRPSYDPTLCQHPSVLEYQGKHYCGRHAGVLALDLWVSGKLVEAPKRKRELCEICKGDHDNDALTDICVACERNINENGSP